MITGEKEEGVNHHNRASKGERVHKREGIVIITSSLVSGGQILSEVYACGCTFITPSEAKARELHYSKCWMRKSACTIGKKPVKEASK